MLWRLKTCSLSFIFEVLQWILWIFAWEVFIEIYFDMLIWSSNTIVCLNRFYCNQFERKISKYEFEATLVDIKRGRLSSFHHHYFRVSPFYRLYMQISRLRQYIFRSINDWWYSLYFQLNIGMTCSNEKNVNIQLVRPCIMSTSTGQLPIYNVFFSISIVIQRAAYVIWSIFELYVMMQPFPITDS